MIHLVNGDSTLGTLKESSVAGDKFSVDDILMEGPIIDGLRSQTAWEIRAEYLERCFSIPRSEYLTRKAERDRILHQALTHDEIVLWFGPDLFCQVNLLYLLDWFAAADLGHRRLALICPGSFPGRERFRCLGELEAQQLESLFVGRCEVTAAQMHDSRAAWQAFGNENPHTIESFLAYDSSSLPLLAAALRTHLRRFPSVENGLGILAQKTLEILSEHPLDFPELFARVTATPEIFHHGMGDLQLRSYLEMWVSQAVPLVESHVAFEITTAGRRVLDGGDDAIRLNGIDLWYGGVHLSGGKPWRWDSRQEALQGVP